ncbi:hypothetical protein Dsin_016844 [Dipteronia sinensis]|uniref:Uncharacterized protein n=1 Tax=Dipteronia sinensis TaxID=43782 RepID=A0AAE0E7C7_9ROSI|nr:hypothetical protein Dsin_016844 [Dipteronia sinensis]
MMIRTRIVLIYKQQVQVISKKLIKPAIPTLSHLQNVNISFIDQISWKIYQGESLDQLQRQRVEYVEALVNGQLSQILQGETESNKLNHFVPDEVEEFATTHFDAIQINIFNCGGRYWFVIFTLNTRRLHIVYVRKSMVLIWRAQINAARARYGRLMSSQLLVLMGLRGDKKLKKIPENCCGNLITLITTRFDQAKESKIWGLNKFIDQVSGAIRNSIMEYAKLTKGPDDNEDDEFFSKVSMKPQIEIYGGIRKGDGDVHLFSSVRKIPFYEAYFGWGNPAWGKICPKM